MNWLARLKSGKAPDTHATKTTKTPSEAAQGVSVVFVACPPAPFQKIEAPDLLAANDAPAGPDAKVAARVEATPAGHDRHTDSEAIRERADEMLGKFADPDQDQGKYVDMRRKGEPKADAGQPPTADIELCDQNARARVLLSKCADDEAAPDGNPEAVSLNKAEADTFTDRRARFLVSGQALEDAERLADKLVIRDREGDDRRVCLECSYYGSSGRCVAAATGRLPGVSARLEPVPTILWRCDAFGLRKGLV